MLKKRNKNFSGFTLVELLITIAIIGILSSVVLTSLTSARKKAVNATIQSSLKQIASVAADPDNLVAGSHTAPTCGEIFTNTEINRLVQFIDEKNRASSGGPVSYCSKSSGEYSFIILSQKYEDPDTYLCVDSNSAVVEVPATNVSWSTDTKICQVSGTPPSEGGGEPEVDEPTPPSVVALNYNAASSGFDIDYSEIWTADSCPFLMLYDVLDDGNVTTASYYHPCYNYIPSGGSAPPSVSIVLSGFENMGSGLPVAENMCLSGHHYVVEIYGANLLGLSSGLTTTSMSATVSCGS